MKKIILMFIGIALIMSCISTTVFAKENIILIDPGHGGIDGGAISKDGILEKDINLNISLSIKKELENAGYKIYMTREEDKGLYKEGQTIRQKKSEDLANRVKMKNSTNADIFISIHQNMFQEQKYKGLQVWYTTQSPESKQLADLIQNTAKDMIDPENKRSPKDAGTQFRVLRNVSKTASVIVECGFLSNPEEAKLLMNSEYQQKFAIMIKESIDKFYQAQNS
ncbi:MAG: N-acetylmuramoyl-L-alanine amidase CwlD [Sarcina sp.]